jgi:hypothetical protein
VKGSLAVAMALAASSGLDGATIRRAMEPPHKAIIPAPNIVGRSVPVLPAAPEKRARKAAGIKGAKAAKKFRKENA